MSFNAQCGKCNIPLENDFLTVNGGEKIQNLKLPSFEVKIKYTLCCGEDMSCAA